MEPARRGCYASFDAVFRAVTTVQESGRAIMRK
jgi:hypothetical protein